MVDRSVRVIDLEGVERRVDGIKWTTTVKELLSKLYPSSITTAKQLDTLGNKKTLTLLEVWQGCSRPLAPNQRVSSILGEWGYHEDAMKEVTLMIVKRSRTLSSKQQMKCWKYRCGRISTRRRGNHYTKLGKSKKAMIQSLVSLLNHLERRRQEVDDLLTPKNKPKEVPSVDINSLPEDQREEGRALLEAIAEERTERDDLEKRKNDLSKKITSQEKALTEVKETVSDLEAKVLNEQHKLNNLLEVKSPPEIEQIHKETAHMKNELKVRTRLNKLQSAKMQELTNAVLLVEDELKSCHQEIELLKLSTPL